MSSSAALPLSRVSPPNAPQPQFPVAIAERFWELTPCRTNPQYALEKKKSHKARVSSSSLWESNHGYKTRGTPWQRQPWMIKHKYKHAVPTRKNNPLGAFQPKTSVLSYCVPFSRAALFLSASLFWQNSLFIFFAFHTHVFYSSESFIRPFLP